MQHLIDMLDEIKFPPEKRSAKKIILVGDVFETKEGYQCQVVKVKKKGKIVVEFRNPSLNFSVKVEVYAANLRKGIVKNPLALSVQGVGYIGVGKYRTKTAKGKPTRAYQAWFNMLQRCYGNLEKYQSYSDCSVCAEWHCFQNFAEWFNQQPGSRSARFQLDKDCIKGNRIYSPDACMLLFDKVNQALRNKSEIARGKKMQALWCEVNDFGVKNREQQVLMLIHILKGDLAERRLMAS